MGSIANNIQSYVRTLKEMLDGKKYQIDYFQREYKWERKHIEQLLVDLEASFFSNYSVDHTIANVVDYNCYYLGPVIISEKGTTKSIVDGQQRLTSMTLLIIYLNNIQKDLIEKEDLESLIYSKRHGRKSYNIEVPDRTKILDALFTGISFDIEEETDESIINMVERYNDISNMFSSELTGDKLSMFIDWLKEKLVFVEIIAQTDENAYTIFETMNDRGLNLTPTEMLKGYILTSIKDIDRIYELNNLWKSQISKLHSFSLQEDLEFMKAWMRGLYADSIRQSAKGAENEDFEKIGTRFHTWIKDNSRKLNLKEPDNFYYFVKGDFQFYSEIYIKILEAFNLIDPAFETLYISSYWNIASSLMFPLYLAPINKLDEQEIINKKIETVAKFLDIYTVSRILGGKPITQSSIRYFIYSLVKDVRNRNLEELKSILKNRLVEFAENQDGFKDFDFYSSDRKFIHYLFARILYYLQNDFEGKHITFDDLMVTRKKTRYVIVPVMGYNFEEYANNFNSEEEFYNYSSSLGNYMLIPNQLAKEIEEMTIKQKLSFLKKEFPLSLLSSNIQLSQWGFSDVDKISAQTIEKRRTAMGRLIGEIWNIQVLD